MMNLFQKNKQMVSCEVLRLGHRPERDKRITTHVALTARAFGANKIHLNRPDSRIVKTISDVSEKFGGNFIIETVSNPKSFVQKWKGNILHLTMFGIPLNEKLGVITKSKEPLLIIVGAEKVPPWVFECSDYNVAVGNQPHSEVSALAITLSKINPEGCEQSFDGGLLEVIPSSERRNMISKE